MSPSKHKHHIFPCAISKFDYPPHDFRRRGQHSESPEEFGGDRLISVISNTRVPHFFIYLIHIVLLSIMPAIIVMSSQMSSGIELDTGTTSRNQSESKGTKDLAVADR